MQTVVGVNPALYVINICLMEGLKLNLMMMMIYFSFIKKTPLQFVSCLVRRLSS